MSRFKFTQTTLGDLYRVDRKPIVDNRGFFSRFFCADEFRAVGFGSNIAQINHTATRAKGTIRGMHFQYSPHADAKLVTCIKGEVLDVAVDIRRGSDTFLKWHAEVLSSHNKRALCIPAGFAHGFQTLVDDCELLYLHSQSYAPHAEGALNALDPMLSIDWPISTVEMSDRDKNHSFIDAHFDGVTN